MEEVLISKKLLKELQLTPAELLIDLAVYLYDKEQLSIGRAKKLAGLTQIEFQKELAKKNVNIKYDVEDFQEDLETLKRLG
ncbi:MAG: UPF0175 family protein [Saprospiraceae bacterium]